jgi:hypothetical protein
VLEPVLELVLEPAPVLVPMPAAACWPPVLQPRGRYHRHHRLHKR